MLGIFRQAETADDTMSLHIGRRGIVAASDEEEAGLRAIHSTSLGRSLPQAPTTPHGITFISIENAFLHNVAASVSEHSSQDRDIISVGVMDDEDGSGERLWDFSGLELAVLLCGQLCIRVYVCVAV